MSLFVMADLHLSSDRSKSMEVFGSRWTNYMEKIRKNWTSVITSDDTVIIPGDISWGMKLEDTADDFAFLDALPGKKLIGKGNHDFWWATQNKIQTFWQEHGFGSLQLLYNNAYRFEDCIVCGTRGWFLEESQQNTVGEVDYTRIVNRETIRLRMSLDAAKALQNSNGKQLPIFVFLHFPPVWNGFECREILNLLHEYEVRDCYFGHIHGAYSAQRTRNFEGIDFVLCAADYLNFAPMPVCTD